MTRSASHLAGDEVLAMVAGVVRDSLRAGQYVGRYAGDEFPWCSCQASIRREPAHFADEVRRTIAAMLQDSLFATSPTWTTSVTLSIGVATSAREW